MQGYTFLVLLILLYCEKVENFVKFQGNGVQCGVLLKMVIMLKLAFLEVMTPVLQKW